MSDFNKLVFIKAKSECNCDESYINVYTITEICPDGGIITTNTYQTSGRPRIYHIKGCKTKDDVMDFMEKNGIFDLNE